MNEPVYTYVKGQGWVYVNESLQSRVFKDYYGNECYLIRANPGFGDKYIACRRGVGFFVDDDHFRPIWEAIIERKWDDIIKTRFDGHNMSESLVYFTVVFVYPEATNGVGT